MERIEIVKSVVFGHAVADALGVPVEFTSRVTLQREPVTGMRGFGTYDMPPGTWSDDTTMALATLDSLAYGINYDDAMRRFCDWKQNAAYTATDEVFDIGVTTSYALNRFLHGTPAMECGCVGYRDNGNGSLMRIYPVVLYCCLLHPDEYSTDAMIQLVHNYSALTHAHPRSMIGCGIYAFVLNALLLLPNKKAAIKAGLFAAQLHYKHSPYVNKMQHYARLFDDNFTNIAEIEIQSGGYVVHSLEAAIWCLLNSNSFEECVLKAVNLGRDTDTVGAITDSLAGAMYGSEAIPAEWMDTLLKKEYIEEICQRF